MNWKIATSIWLNPNEQLDNARTDTGRMVPLLFFYPLSFFFWQFNQFCRLCNYLNRKPPGPGRPPCICSWRATLLLMEHFFHPHPKVAAVQCQVGHCRATWDSLPSQVSMCRPVHSNGAPGKAVSLPASPNFLPVSKLGKTLDEAGCIRKYSVQRAGRVCFQEPLAGFLKGV